MSKLTKYTIACPRSPIHYQLDPVQTTKTSVIGTINLPGLAAGFLRGRAARDRQQHLALVPAALRRPLAVGGGSLGCGCRRSLGGLLWRLLLGLLDALAPRRHQVRAGDNPRHRAFFGDRHPGLLSFSIVTTASS